jgi:hypothetical protein
MLTNFSELTLEALRATVAQRVDARIEEGSLIRGPVALEIELAEGSLKLKAPPEPARLLALPTSIETISHHADLLLFRAEATTCKSSALVQLTEGLCALPGATRLGANRLSLGDLHIEVLVTGLRIEAFIPFSEA